MRVYIFSCLLYLCFNPSSIHFVSGLLALRSFSRFSGTLQRTTHGIYNNNNMLQKSVTSLRGGLILGGNEGNNDDEIEDDTPEDAIGAPVGPLPSVSSRYAWDESAPKSLVHDLWVVGAGTLGMVTAKQWKSTFPGASVVAETKSLGRHAELAKNGITPRLRESRANEDAASAKNVLVALPPSSCSSVGAYLNEIGAACEVWAGPRGGGKLVFTSSISVYGDSLGNIVNEAFRVDTRSKRSSTMLEAEMSITCRGGSVIRLAGLYTETRGPHTMWLRNGTVDAAADGIINLLHYSDASNVALAALLRGSPGSIYLACDDDPISRRDICEAALASGLFPGTTLPTFTSEIGPIGKICDSSVTRKQLSWEPQHKSFDEYMRSTIGKKPFTPRKAMVSAAKAKEAKSALWIPGDDDEILE